MASTPQDRGGDGGEGHGIVRGAVVDAEDVTEPSSSTSPSTSTLAVRASASPTKKRKWVDSTNAKENESLLKRMGGPSAAKAGLGKDQDEVRRVDGRERGANAVISGAV